MSSPTCILILGMHRSGTSALTRLCALAGAALPRVVIESLDGNEKGHWESKGLATFNDKFLHEQKQTWDDFRTVDISDETRRRYMSEFSDVIKADFGDAPLIIVKEPRTARFADLTIQSLEAMGYRVCPVHAVRHPLEVAQSLKARNNIPVTLGALYWLRHTLDVETDLQTRDHRIVPFNKTLSRGAEEVRDLFAQFDLPEPDATFEEAAKEFVSPELRHHDVKDWDDASELRDWIKTAYETISGSAPKPPTKKDLAALKTIDAQFTGATGLLHALKHQIHAADKRGQALMVEAKNSEAELAKEVDVIKATLAASEAKTERIQDEARGFWKDLQASRANTDAARVDVDLVRSQMTDARAEIKSAQSEAAARVAELKNELTASEARTKSVQDEARTIWTDLQESRASTDTARAEIKSAQSEASERVAELKNELTASEARTKSVQDDARTIWTDLQASRANTDAVRDTLDAIKLALTQSETNLAITRAEAKAAQAKVGAQTDVFKLELAAAQAETVVMRESMQRDVNRLADELEEKNTGHAKAKKSLLERITALETECDTERNQTEYTKEALNLKNEEYSAIQSTLNRVTFDHEQDMKSMTSELHALQEEHRKLDLKLEEKRNNISSLSDQVRQLMQEHDDTQMTLSNIEDQLAAEKSKASTLRQQHQQDQQDARVHTDRIVELERTLAFEHAHSKSREIQLTSLHQSTSWRMTSPLRKVVGLWRNKSRLVFGLLAGRQIRELMNSQDLHQSIDASKSPAVQAARQALQSNRDTILDAGWMRARLTDKTAASDLPNVTISAVTYNSEKWLWNFFVSIEHLDYPMDKISIHFVDNGSTDNTIEALQTFVDKNITRYRSIIISERPNLGYGAGNDWAVQASQDDYVLVTNVDIQFYRDSLRECVSFALADKDTVACWEFRQTPYEHPKYYDPVTLETNWNAHACVLFRRSAYVKVGGYDKKIFMYGEDVELSYRFRAHGYTLRYVPDATIYHHVDLEDLSKRPNQLSGSTAANILLRYRYGTYRDIAAGEALLQAVRRNEFDPVRIGAFEKSGQILRESRSHFWRKRPSRSLRRQHHVEFPFNEFDYDLTRPGADTIREPFRSHERDDLPLVTIVTRTHGPSDNHLRNAIACVLNQTYKNVEHIIVEDKTEDGREIVEHAAAIFGEDRIRYFRNPGNGRSECGNFGASQARGKWICWLDNDDLLFADHIETLVRALDDAPDAVCSYALAWEAKADMVDGKPVMNSLFLPPVHNQPYDKARLMRENFIPIQAIIFRKDLFDLYGGFNPKFSQLEDWNLWVRYSNAGDFVFTPKVTSIYLTPDNAEVRTSRHELLHEAYETVRTTNLKDAAGVMKAKETGSTYRIPDRIETTPKRSKSRAKTKS